MNSDSILTAWVYLLRGPLSACLVCSVCSAVRRGVLLSRCATVSSHLYPPFDLLFDSFTIFYFFSIYLLSLYHSRFAPVCFAECCVLVYVCVCRFAGGEATCACVYHWAQSWVIYFSFPPSLSLFLFVMVVYVCWCFLSFSPLNGAHFVDACCSRLGMEHQAKRQPNWLWLRLCFASTLLSPYSGLSVCLFVCLLSLLFSLHLNFKLCLAFFVAFSGFTVKVHWRALCPFFLCTSLQLPLIC